MTTIESIVRTIQRDLSPAFEERLRAELAGMDRAWLIDQIVRLTMDAHSLQEFDRATERAVKDRARSQRIARVRAMAVSTAEVITFRGQWMGVTRDALVARGLLRADAPPKGGDALASAHREAAGEELLERAKDMLFALLFGDGSTGTDFARTSAELLTLAVPRAKAACVDFLRASTETVAAGTWQDPTGSASDDRADNVLIDVQYGETADEAVGPAIIAALTLINHLEINQQGLYARMINIEDTTLIA